MDPLGLSRVQAYQFHQAAALDRTLMPSVVPAIKGLNTLFKEAAKTQV